MKILVTGGAGFIGSNIVDSLVEQGHDVVVVDNLSTGFARNLHPKARFYPVSILDTGLAEVFQKEKPEIVNHHAAQTVIVKSVEDPAFDASENILGSLKLLQLCLRFGVKKLIYASSGGAVYGEPKYLPADEKHPVSPISQYGISKHTVEHYINLYSENLDFTVLRYANVYGPRQNPAGEAGVVAIFAGKMLRGEQPTIFGKGDKTRDYIFVGDVVKANLLALDKGSRGIYNIGTGVETSDQEMFDALAEALKYKGSPIYAPYRKGEVQRIYLDCARAQREMGWQAKVSLREGLAQAVGYYRKLFASSTETPQRKQG